MDMDTVHPFHSVVRHGQDFHHDITRPHLCAESRIEVLPDSYNYTLSSGHRGSDRHRLQPSETRRRLVEPFGWYSAV